MQEKIFNNLQNAVGGCIRVGTVGADNGIFEKISSALNGYDMDVKPYSDDCTAIILVCSTIAEVNTWKSKNKPLLVLCPQHMLEEMQKEGGFSVEVDNLFDDEKLIRGLLFACPVKVVDVDISAWVQAMPEDSSAVKELKNIMLECAQKVNCMGDCSLFYNLLEGSRYWQESVSVSYFFDEGRVCVKVDVKEDVFYEMLSELSGSKIDGEYALMNFVREASKAKNTLDGMSSALECAKINGYGVVMPEESAISFQKPEVVQKGTNVGIKLKATAPIYHIIRVDVEGEVCPVMGNAAQSEPIVKGMMDQYERASEELWKSNLFGKSLKDMMVLSLEEKSQKLSDDVKGKLKKALSRLVNEGKGGVICILL